MSRTTLTVRLRDTTRTDLVCIACGGFRTELAVVVPGDRNDLLVAEGADPSAGIHKRCLKLVKGSRARRRKAAAPTCGHSECSQHFIDTGRGDCVKLAEGGAP